jgi:hypothetical protein
MLESISAPDAFRPAVETALREVERLAPIYRVPATSATARLLQARTRSHSFIGVIELGEPGHRCRFFLKTVRANATNLDLKRAQLEREFAMLEELSLRFTPHSDLTVIKPVLCWPEQLSMLTEEFPGVTIERFLSTARRVPTSSALSRAAAVCRRVGRWLALFQGFTKPHDTHLFDATELVRYCERRCRILRDSAAHGFDLIAPRDLLALLERLAATAGADELVQVGRQNDFRPDNMLTDGRRVAVLDFTGFTYGPALYDFMKFQMKIEDLARGLSLRPRAVTAWQVAYAEGYGTPVDFKAPLAQLLRVANLLDKMSEFPLWQGATASTIERRWRFRHYQERLRDLKAILTGRERQ